MGPTCPGRGGHVLSGIPARVSFYDTVKSGVKEVSRHWFAQEMLEAEGRLNLVWN